MRNQFPNSWESVKLGSFVESEKGKKPKRQSVNKSAKFKLPYVDIQAFEEGIINSWTNGDGCRLCYKSDFLMVWDGARSGLVGKGMKGALGSTLVRINFPGMDNQYAYYFLLSKYQEINTRAKGSGTPHVDPDLLWNYDFPIAPLNEQKRIVAKIEELFSELDNGIAALKTAREQLKIYRQAVLKHAFEGKLTAKWREENADKLETSEQLLARIQREREARYQQQLNEWQQAVKHWEAKNKEGKKPGKPKAPSQLSILESDLPHGWIKVSIDWLLTTEKKPMTTGPFGTALKKSEHQLDGVPVLGIENIGNGKFVPGNKVFVSEAKAAELVSFRVYAGEIVISRSGTVGEICEVPDDVTKALISTNLLRISLDSNIILSPFFVLMFQGGGVKLQVKELCRGSSREFLNQSILSSIRYPICGLEEQKVLLAQLEVTFSIVDQQEKEIEESLYKAEVIRQSILKKAFYGQLVPQDPNDEPASELLVRIKAEKANNTKGKSVAKLNRKKKEAEANG